MSTILGWEIYQYDIDTAFLEAKLDEDLYMRPPEGLNCAPDEVCKLQRSLYGTRQANRNFYVLIVTFLTNEGYVQSAYDPCLFYGMEVAEDPDSINIRVYVFVDDFIVTAPTTAIFSNSAPSSNLDLESRTLVPLPKYLACTLSVTSQTGPRHCRKKPILNKCLKNSA